MSYYLVKYSGNYVWICKNDRHISCVYCDAKDEFADAEKDAQDLVDLANAQRTMIARETVEVTP